MHNFSWMKKVFFMDEIYPFHMKYVIFKFIEKIINYQLKYFNKLFYKIFHKFYNELI